MNARLIFASLASLLVTASAVADWEALILPRDFQSESSLAKAVFAAKQAGKHVILYYTRTNCPPCRVLQGRLRIESVAKPYRESYVFTAVWGSSMGDSEREHYRRRFGVLGAPTWLAFTNDGKYICTSSGGFETDQGAAALHQAIQAHLAGAEENASNEPRSCI